jgi:hypothetical protein
VRIHGIVRVQRDLREAAHPDPPWVFHNDGARIVNPQKAWRKAIEAATQEQGRS